MSAPKYEEDGLMAAHPDPLTSIASVHADSPLLAAAADVDRLTSVLPDGAPTYREETAEHLADHIHQYLRDSNAIITLRIDGLTRQEWDDADGRLLTGWRKRREHRHPDSRQLIAVVEYDTDEGWE